MAREKTWVCRQNISVSDTDDATTAQKWMYELYNLLSGGVGDSDAKWTILSASDGSSTGGGGLITDSTDMNWGTGAHTWWVCRKDILPVTASTTRYIYLTVDLNQSNDNSATFLFDYEEPNFGSQTTSARPPETANAYSKTTQYRHAYDVGNDTYFHGTIDTTGSFHVVAAQQRGTTGPQYDFSLSCARLETPRAAEVDRFPVFLKCGFVGNSSVFHGPWGVGDNADVDGTSVGCIYWAANSTCKAQWDNVGGQAMWSHSGTLDSDHGFNAGFLIYANGYFGGGKAEGLEHQNPYGSMIDSTYPLLPSFVCMQSDNPDSTAGTPTVRGRLPDVFMCFASANPDASVAGQFGLGGLTIPKTGDIEYSVAGDCFLPFSASLRPGT
jgi:hypothetical protein